MNTLRDLIRAKGKRQNQLAELLGVSEPIMSRWANRQASIPARVVLTLAFELGVSAEEILGVADPVPVPEAAA